ncbi:putative pantothenate kinase [Helianthus annuus]|nr:putative pantothenate kinase [Helianthus annuus]KAJ0484323.1 putative pantothenate kinase [Helianthus annuus]KAJ0654876.1 putative pantothenate kinase [Helianthus annuus]KAJ0658611.1 putative pantothenate kinase [Helianthus annuus]
MDSLKEDQSDTQAIENINEDAQNISEKEGTEKDMAPPVGNSIHRSGSRPQLDLSGAAIQGNFEERDPTILLPNQSDDISHLALDIGGHSCDLLSSWFIFRDTRIEQSMTRGKCQQRRDLVF